LNKEPAKYVIVLHVNNIIINFWSIKAGAKKNIVKVLWSIKEAVKKNPVQSN